MSRIPVVFTPDNGFAVPTSVAILSMLEHKNPETEYYFYIIVGSDFDSANISLFEKIERIFAGFQYKFIRIDDKIFSSLKINTKHLTTSAFYRLFVSSILPDEKKAMYHDGDILVMDDLSSFFDIEPGDDYVYGVPSIYGVQYGQWRNERVTKWGFEHTDDYMFSGDMIMNLEKIREDDLETQFAEHMTYGYPSEDQDVLNRCCIGKKGKLPLRFCMLTRWVGNHVIESFDICPYSAEEIFDAQNNPAIVHFAGAEAKPWVNIRAKYASEWFGYLKHILDEKEYSNWFDRAQKLTDERDWAHIESIVMSNLVSDKAGEYKRDIVIYGFGSAGKELYSSLKANGYSVSAIIDKNLNDKSVNTAAPPIYSPEIAVGLFNSSMIIISVQGEFDNICNELIHIGFNDAQFVQYKYKSDFYYQVIDKNYIITEENDKKSRNGLPSGDS